MGFKSEDNMDGSGDRKELWMFKESRGGRRVFSRMQV